MLTLTTLYFIITYVTKFCKKKIKVVFFQNIQIAFIIIL